MTTPERNNEYLSRAMTLITYHKDSSMRSVEADYTKAAALLLIDIAESLRRIEKTLDRS